MSAPDNTRSCISRIEPLARHVGRLLVFVVDLEEARGLTRRLGDRLIAVAFGCCDDAVSVAVRTRHHLIGVGLAPA